MWFSQAIDGSQDRRVNSRSVNKAGQALEEVQRKRRVTRELRRGDNLFARSMGTLTHAAGPAGQYCCRKGA